MRCWQIWKRFLDVLMCVRASENKEKKIDQKIRNERENKKHEM